MVNRKRKKGIFGSKFNFWDILMVIAVLGSGYFIYNETGTEEILLTIAKGVFYGLALAIPMKYIISRAGR